MKQRMVCKRGHVWEIAVNGDSETADIAPRCPVCADVAGSPMAVGDVDPLAETLPPRSPSDGANAATSPSADNRQDHQPHISGYELIRELGRGGMGVVYLARHLELGRLVALKMVIAGNCAGDTERARFRAEAAAVARLQHPNIVQLFEAGESEGRPFFCLEFVDAGSLVQQLDGTPVPSKEAAQFLIPIAQAMHTAHQQDLVHRDLKPGNILLRRIAEPTENGKRGEQDRIPLTAFQPKITDFGLVKNLEDAGSHTQSGAVLGTPSYMAPEQAGGQTTRIGPATDVYSIGAILYELLTGRPPFRGETPLDTVLQVMNDEPVRPSALQPKCSRDLETICLKCLEKDPRKRYASAQELADDLQRFLNNEPIKARPIGPLGRTKRWAIRHPGVAALLVVIVLLVSTGFAVVLALWQRSESDRKAAISGRQQAARQEQRARANLAMAIEAVDRMLTRVADERLAYVPQFEDERRKILEEAVAFYNSFLQQEESDPSLRREMGRAYYRLGKVFMSLGKHQQALESFRQAQKFQTDLAAEFPQEAGHRGDLALTLCYLGDTYRLSAKIDEADPLYLRALELAEALVRDFPDNAGYREILAEAVQRQGLHFFQTRRLDEAERSFERSIVELRQLLNSKPNDFKLRLQYADALSLLGYFQQNLRRFEPAEKNLKAAVAEFEAMIKEYPDRKHECEPKLAGARLHLGAVYTATNRAADADALLRLGMKTFEQLVRDYPKSPNYRFVLARGHQTIASRIRQGEKPEQAEIELQSAIATLEQLDRDHPEAFYQGITLRQCYRELGQLYSSQKKADLAVDQYRKAVANAEADEPTLPRNSPVHFELDQNRLALSRLLTTQGKFTEAVEQIQKAIEHTQALDPKTPGLQDQLINLKMHKAGAMAGAGAHAEAIAEALAVASARPKSPTVQYNLACVYALCARAVREDTRLPSNERAAKSNEFDERAVAVLQQLKSAGYFRANPGNVRMLLTDPDLEPLRNRPAGQKFFDEFRLKPK